MDPTAPGPFPAMEMDLVEQLADYQTPDYTEFRPSSLRTRSLIELPGWAQPDWGQILSKLLREILPRSGGKKTASQTHPFWTCCKAISITLWRLVSGPRRIKQNWAEYQRKKGKFYGKLSRCTRMCSGGRFPQDHRQLSSQLKSFSSLGKLQLVSDYGITRKCSAGSSATSFRFLWPHIWPTTTCPLLGPALCYWSPRTSLTSSDSP